MKQEIEFYGEGSPYERPTSVRTIYVDGTAGSHFRGGIDVELSHWRPNQTDEQYKAGTSTEICFKYLHLNKTQNYGLVVNNHLDVDGVLSVFVLTHPTVALAHEDVIIKAAEVGDFWAWSEGKAFNLFQELSLIFKDLESPKRGLGDSYQQCFELITKILQERTSTTEAEKILLRQYALVEEGKIIREELNERIVSYHVPKETTKGDDKTYLNTAKFNEPISERLAFWPQVRNRRDAQKLQLVSIETEKGIHHELFVPGYCWADTVGLWQPPGLVPAEDVLHGNKLHWDDLSKVVAELNAREPGPCHWNLFSTIDFFNKMNPRNFPIILTTVYNGNVRSQLSLESVKDAFRGLVGTETLWT